MGMVNDATQVVCRDHAIWLSLGGFQETSADGERLHNTHVIVDNAGEITAVYRKIHLFDVDVSNGPKLLESASTAPGFVPHYLLGQFYEVVREKTITFITIEPRRLFGLAEAAQKREVSLIF
jgi:predicted amidohydrolase